MSATVTPIKGSREAPKALRSRMETLILSAAEIDSWELPPFQRPLRVNAKVHEIAAKLAENGGLIEGVITLGIIPPSKALYIVDGQHRREAFRLSAMKEGMLDLRIVEFESMTDMAIEFNRLNTPIARMTPDDNLRALEFSIPALAEIRKACPFVGYGQVRRGDSPGGPVVGMAIVLKTWAGSGRETPGGGLGSAAVLAQEMSDGETQQLITFLTMALRAWGRDPEYWRLWGALNMLVAMWLYRRLVIDQTRGLKRAVVLSPQQFEKCLMGLSADAPYLDWLVGRSVGDRDRSPCYARMTSVFVKRLIADTKGPTKKVLMPNPAWAGGRGN